MLQASVEVKNALHGESLKGANQFLSLNNMKEMTGFKTDGFVQYTTLSLPPVFKRYHLASKV